MAKTSIAVHITGDVRDLKRAFGEAENAAQQMGRKMNEVGNKLTLGVTLPLAAMGAKAVTAASDLEEALDKTDVIFGDSARVVQEWSETSAEAMGIASSAALDAAGNIGNMFQSAGVSADEAAQLSMDLVQLAADMGSLNNVDPGEMLIKLQSGLAGEAEPLRRFGVDINAAAVEAKALELGLVGVGEELSNQDKLIARYQIIMDQTGTAQGNFALTAESAANQTRILRASVENLAAEFGNNLLPIAKDVLEIANDLVGGFSDLDDGVQKALVTGAIAAAVSGPLLKLGGLISGLVGKVMALVAAFKTAGLGGAILGVSKALGGLAAAAGTAGTVGAAAGLAAVAVEADRVKRAMWEGDEASADWATTLDASGPFGKAVLAGFGIVERFGIGAEDAASAIDDELRASLNESIPTIDDWRSEAHGALVVTDEWPEPLMAAAKALGEVDEAAGGAAVAIGLTGQAMLDALNPAKQLRTANENYEEALRELQRVQGDSEASTEDVEEAMWNLLEAQGEVQAASENFGVNFDEQGFRALAQAAGFTADEINRLINAIGGADGASMKVDVETSGGNIRSVKVGSDWGRNSGPVVRHDGGVIPGRPGQEVLTLLKAGETVLPTHKPGFGMGGMGGPSIYIANVYGWDDFVTRVRDAGVDIQRLGL